MANEDWLEEKIQGAKQIMKGHTICELISKFPEKRILVIGDIIIDQYIYGTATGLSAETPTVVAKELNTVTTLGGAFLLVRNLLELGAQVAYFSVIGKDGVLVDAPPATSRLGTFFWSNLDKRTTRKKRIWVDGYKLLQLDTLEEPELIDLDKTKFPGFSTFIELFAKKVGFCDLVVVSDYRHGLLTENLIRDILLISKNMKKPVYVDSQISRKFYSESNYEQYKGADVFCMNLREAQFTDPDFSTVFDKLKSILGSDKIVIKLGAKGSLASVKGRWLNSGGFKVNAVDPCGAGDAFLAALCLCDLENSPAESLRIANAWAALSCTIHGTEPPKKEQLLELLGADNEILS